MEPSGRVGIKDVARVAGVSLGTVSNVLNHPDRVRGPRREAVEDAIRELGFVRHESARHLRAGYSTTIGLLLLDAWNPGFIDLAHGVEDVTARRGMTVITSNSARDSEREATYLRLFAEQRVAGVIAVPHDHPSEGIERLRASGVPVVVVDHAEGDAGGQNTMSVAVDDISGGELAAKHLLDLGHRHLAFVGDETLALPIRDRLIGVRKAIDAYNATGAQTVRLDVLPAELTTEAGREVGENLARLPSAQRPTGVAAGVDLLAIGALQGMLQHGIRVPQDLSLVGYDDIPFALQLSVPLTTIRRPHYDMGIRASEMLTATLAGTIPPARHIVFDPQLIVRRSTGPVRRK